MLAAAVLVALLCFANAETVILRGLNPELAAHYSGSGGTFQCIAGGTKPMPFSRVNDDYCDCPDGSDEPGTSACHNGRFYCRNLGHEPRLLASAFVDDGVCDCCDGTDETKGKCQNTCLQASAVHKEALRNQISNYENALRTKAEYVTKARSFKEEMRLKASTIDDDIARQQAEVDRLKGEVDRMEQEEAAVLKAQEEAAAALKAQEEAAAALKAQEEVQRAVEQSATEHGATVGSSTEQGGNLEAPGDHGERQLLEGSQQQQPEEREETPEERGRRIASQWTNDPDAAAVPTSQDEVTEQHVETEEGHYDEDNHGDYDKGTDLSHEDEHVEHEHEHWRPPRRHEAAAGTAERDRSAESPSSEWEDLMLIISVFKEWAARWIRTLSKVWKQGIRNDVLEHRNRMKARINQRVEKLAGEGHAPTPSLHTRRTTAPGGTDTSTPLGEARSRMYTVERILHDLQKDKENIDTYLDRGLDFGPDDVFLALANQCYSSHQTRWTYEICMFKNAVQKEGYTNSVTVGRWQGFADDYKQMLFTGGDECWNVGPRSMRVTMSCGNEEQLSDGEEPATCAYAAKFTTPIACTENGVEALRGQLRNLEAFEEVVRKKIEKDEL